MSESEAEGRSIAAELEPLLGVKLPVLDDGFVRVVDYLGSDDAIVQAARVSYGRGTKKVSEDRGLIRYLMRHRHTTPFEMCELKIHVRVPMDTWRQWIRHRTANVNEYSTRYSLAIDASQRTAADAWRAQSQTNKQGSDALIEPSLGETLSQDEAEFHKRARAIYEDRIQKGVAREQARKDLPLSTYTEAYWKIDLHNLLNFLELRMDAHAQVEIRAYASTIGESIVKRWCPLAWEAFVDYRLQSLGLTRLDVEVISALSSSPTQATSVARAAGLLPTEGTLMRPNREREELEHKLRRLGLAIPWLSQPSSPEE